MKTLAVLWVFAPCLAAPPAAVAATKIYQGWVVTGLVGSWIIMLDDFMSTTIPRGDPVHIAEYPYADLAKDDIAARMDGDRIRTEWSDW